jgi:hypothetical protein
LISAITTVNLSPSNGLYFGYSLSQLLEILFEINFSAKKIIPIMDSLKLINSNLDNYVEIACLYERMI